MRRGPRLVGAMAVLRAGRSIAPAGNFETPAAGIVAEDDDASGAVARGLLGLGARRVALEPITADSPTLRALEDAAAEGRHRLVLRTTMECPVVNTDGGWDAYWGSLSRNLRHKVERCTRRAREGGAFEIDVRDRFADHDEMDRLLDEGFAVEGSGWKTAEGTAISTSPLARRYYTDLARWAGGEGWLRLTYIRVNGRAIAFGLGVEAFGVHHALKIGYDPGAARLSPGTLLLHALIRRSFAVGLARFDFAGHLEPYKAVWATAVERHLSLVAFPPTAAGRAAHRLEVARVALAESRIAPALRPGIAAARRLTGAVRGTPGTQEPSPMGRG